MYYGKDAFEGLRLMDLLTTGKSDEIDQEVEQRLHKRADSETKVAAMEEARQSSINSEPDTDSATATLSTATRSNVARDVEIPSPPFWGSRVVEKISLTDVYGFINKVALYRGQWQFKKGGRSDAEYEAFIEDKVDPIFERLSAMCRDEAILQPQVVYGYYPASGDGDDLIVYDPTDPDQEIERFTFPRQAGRHRLCISDFFRAAESGQRDVLGLTCVTVGNEASRRAKDLFEANNYSEYLYLHGFGVESAEALAESWHKRMRQELGIVSEDSPKIRQLFTQKYRGSRYSFGYPACPDMSDQEKLFRLLDPSRIGCVLTENWQIDPEQSTSAIIVHHPQAKYFAV